jgi:hypothetical protein
MKTITSFFMALMLLAFITECPVWAQSELLAYTKSPDHPSTWVVGATNIHQAFRWDTSKQMLFADVKYSTRDYADSIHPTQEGDYALSFPSVHLDSSTNKLTAHGTTIGALHHGILGSEVVLKRGLELDIHRHHGKIYAAIVPGPSDNR